MLIEPVKPVAIVIKIGSDKYDCQMVSLSHAELELSCREYLDKETSVFFVAKFFRGKGLIYEVKFNVDHFIYKLNIEEIQFQPGLLIDTSL
ncbi:MAG: hypothetical protein EPN84_10330 [Legionella sp.]|nr:MAG: hypothetical protein EPN84_10330 [Legionella sp.]